MDADKVKIQKTWRITPMAELAIIGTIIGIIAGVIVFFEKTFGIFG